MSPWQYTIFIVYKIKCCVIDWHVVFIFKSRSGYWLLWHKHYPLLAQCIYVLRRTVAIISHSFFYMALAAWPWQTQHSTRRKLFTRKLDLSLRKELAKCYNWSIALYGAETWTIRKVYHKILIYGATDGWRTVGPIVWKVEEERNILLTIKERKVPGFVTSCIGTAFKNTLLKERQRKWREDEEEDAGSYCKTLRKRDDTLNWKRKH